MARLDRFRWVGERGSEEQRVQDLEQDVQDRHANRSLQEVLACAFVLSAVLMLASKMAARSDDGLRLRRSSPLSTYINS